ncbi:hypothetical protein [Pseudarthrobacter sp. NIBRBAC000502771]|uniref:hypothetical protein n=1 Tax=Pseudarthrobacter sp. NIBRBAC000502771 TaxID=2590774 RepID=UPI0011312F55|nr:hypothetical protein [Pseudarthrobacter sp. NIBRBAC000502771]QDG62518.1 hypothetical protein NIBR502771_09410 [Pseudarthrobacter sp. NIBRBAC000502771]
MRWDESPEDRGRVKFAAAAEAVEGYGGRGLNGRALQPASGYLFPDQDGEGWWVVFQPWPSAGPEAHRVPGDVLACNDSYGDMVHVVVLASGVWEDDAEAAFRSHRPSSLADAARVAASVAHISQPHISRRGPTAAG